MAITRDQIVKVETPYFVKGGNLRAKVHYRESDDEPVQKRVFNLHLAGDYDDQLAFCPLIQVEGRLTYRNYGRLEAGAIDLPAEIWQKLGNRYVDDFVSHMGAYSPDKRRGHAE